MEKDLKKLADKKKKLDKDVDKAKNKALNDCR